MSGQFAVLSAHRQSNTGKANKSGTSQLRTAIQRRHGLGYVRLQGVGQEIDKHGKTKPAREKSIFVPNMSRAAARREAVRHKQDYFIHHDGKGEVHLVHAKTGETHEKWSHLSHAPSDYSSEIRPSRHRKGSKAKKFVFTK